MKKIIIFLLYCLSISSAFACTTAIVSGKYTVDGRPLLWKHRDSDTEDNKLMYFADGRFPYIGLINAGDSLGAEVWAGSNSVGFSIMNSASYNLKDEETALKDQEGLLMKQALQRCETLSDFELLLNETIARRGIEANFGVIDAFGGAAYYETDDTSYVKFDANDPRIAPFGYIVRTNYSFTGKIDAGYGYIRLQTAERLFFQAAAENKLSYDFILRDCDRNLSHSLTGVDLKMPPYPPSKENARFIPFEDFINRHSSTASLIVHGIRPGEPIELTTIWTVLGFPPCSVAVPSWVAAGRELPAVLTAPGTRHAPLCDRVLQLKQQCFPITRGSGYKYLNLSALFTANNDGIMQILSPVEGQIVHLTEGKLSEWRKSRFTVKQAKELYQAIDEIVRQAYAKHFNLQ